MRAWSQNRAELIRQSEAIRRQQNQYQGLDARIKKRSAHLAAAVADFGAPTASENRSLAQLVADAERILAAAANDGEQRRAAEKELRRLETNRRQALESAAGAQEKLNAWEAQWTDAIAGVPLETTGTPAEANVILDLLTILAQQLHDVKQQRGRIAQIDDYAARFAEDVRTLTTEVAADSLSSPADQAAAALGQRLARAIADDQQYALLSKQLAAAEKGLQTALETIAETQSQLAALSAEAHCADPSELPAAEERAPIAPN